MSETPKTDSFELDYATTGGGWGRPFDFARELERKTVTQAETIRMLCVRRAEQDNALSDIGKILGDESMASAEIIKRVAALCSPNTADQRRSPE